MDRPRYRDLQAAQMRKIAVVLDRRRPWILGGATIVCVAVLSTSGFPGWRLGAIGALFLLVLGWQVFRNAVLARRGPVSDGVIFANLLVVDVVYATFVAIAGGLHGPFIAMLFPMVIAGTTRFGRGRESVALLVTSAALVLALGLMPRAWGGPPLPPWAHACIAVVTVTVTLLSAFMNIAAVTDAYGQAGEMLDRTREQVLTDLTERERSLATMGAKVAHELKNPLAAIKGLVQLVASAAPDPRSRERLDVVLGEVGRMEDILRDYLSFARPLEDLKPARVDLAGLVDDVLAVLEARAAQVSVRLTRTGQGAEVVGDPRRLKEALLNLASNALEATPAGGSIDVRVDPRADGAEIVVVDTGRGIPPEVMSRIGTPFFTTRDGGTGLGVVLARSVVQQHGGELRVASEPGRGTTVTLTLPREPPR